MTNALVAKIPFFTLGATAVAFFAHPVDGTYIAVVGLLVTSLAKIVSETLNRRNDRERDERHRKWDREDREENRTEVRAELAKNTALTIQSAEASERAIDIGNHQNEKLIRLTEKLGEDRTK